ncbi:hypothetical protein [Jiangella asiatica]|uniref:Uncharacterized protein n=1 Tax=Jiangella asiatica TaxID=2530372 RepID=A0A4R5CM11_9ACTN|nr:hypothetical protein [Jiangella asiatica]TDE00317.1 hypothetical protein E1269_25675 [Jiangella asiatica]
MARDLPDIWRAYGDRVANKSDDDVTVLRVDPTVWAHALKAADGDARRIEIRGEFDVVVHNDPLPPGQRVNVT